MRILLVEDDAAVREIIEEMLRDDGNIVHSADCVNSALSVVEQIPSPDLLVTDFNLGEKATGVDLAKTLRRIGRLVPVLIVSGRPDLVGAHLGRLPKARFLPKPFTCHDLIDAVHQTVKI